MHVDPGNYDFKGFCREICDSQAEAFSGYHYNQVKAFFYVAEEGWNPNFSDRFDTTNFGDITRLTTQFENRKGAEERAVFFVGPYGEDDELISVLTAETEEAIKQVLLPALNSRGDISPMPILTEDFQRMNQIVLGEYPDMRVTEFKSERIPDLADAQVRPSVQRTVEYKGRDGREAAEEFKQRYGVVPVRVQYEKQDIELRVDTSGKFTLKKVNQSNFNLLFEVIEEVVESVLELKELTQKIRFKQEEVNSGNLSISVPKIEAGEVDFDREFTRVLAEDFVEGTRQNDRVDFSFTDVKMEAGSLDFSAQVSDERRDSFFNISATSDGLKIVPERGCSFPSLIEFYLCILQTVDAGAEMDLYGAAA
jgi:hypothetical protein